MFDAAVNYYNNNLEYYDRSEVTNQTYNNLQTRLYNMEKAIDNALMDCSAYQDIVIIDHILFRNVLFQLA